MKNIWSEYKDLKQAFPIGCEVILDLPADDYPDMAWLNGHEGLITGYDVANLLAMVTIMDGIEIKAARHLLKKTASLTEGWDC